MATRCVRVVGGVLGTRWVSQRMLLGTSRIVQSARGKDAGKINSNSDAHSKPSSEGQGQGRKGSMGRKQSTTTFKAPPNLDKWMTTERVGELGGVQAGLGGATSERSRNDSGSGSSLAKQSVPTKQWWEYEPKYTLPEHFSKRKRFNSIFVPPVLLQHLDTLEVGRARGRRRSHLVTETDWQRVCTEMPVFRSKLSFLGGARTSDSFLTEHPGVKEIAFVGRSNVGKSSLINTLTKSAPAKAEDKPGVTKTVNFYALNKTNLNVVDLPGYGFAFGKDEDKAVWQQTMNDYLKYRTALKRIYLLLDARHGIKEIDREFMDYLDRGVKRKYQVVLTKCDQVEATSLARRMMIARETIRRRPYALGQVLAVSATTRGGVMALRSNILEATGIRSGRSTTASKQQDD
eukprot:m.139510 g.139510  ORF g.139510 m.139510 type:complete len:403 (+) comp14016_c1_seq5:31-1239(+)